MASFVTHSGPQLLLDGRHFRFTGANIYWLGLSNVALTSGGQTIHTSANGLYYPSRWAIGDALSTAKEMGMTVVRSLYLGISVGDPLSVCPTLSAITNNQPNVTAFNTIDYSIYLAGQLGIKLLIPFIDNYYYNNVGKRTFTNWRGITSGGQGAHWQVEEQAFFTNAQVINDFQNYIALFLNRVNQFNGLEYKNDPTILAWETGNEISPPPSWTATIANYIKSLDGNHLVMDGTYINNTDPLNGTFTAEQLNIANVDIVSNHFYPTYNQIAANDAAQAAGVSSSFPNATPAKAYIIGEYNWTYTPTAAATAAIDTTTAPDGYSQSARVSVTSATSAAYRVQLFEPLNNGINVSSSTTLFGGTTYVFSFYAKATGNVPGRIMGSLIQMTTAPYSTHGMVNAVLTGNWQRFSVTFVMPQTDNTAAIAFNVGDAVDKTWITGISLLQQDQWTNLVRNPNFATNTNFTSPPWVLHLPPLTMANDLLDFLHNAVEINPAISGACLWSLMPHADTYGFAIQTDGYSMYYPDGLISGRNQTVDQAARMQIIRAHGYKLQGAPSTPSALIVRAPVLTVTLGNPNVIAWTGIVGARAYSVERASITGSSPSPTPNPSPTPTPSPLPFPGPSPFPTSSPFPIFFPFASVTLNWSVIGTYTDFQTPVKDTATNCVYRVRAQNVDGQYGQYSLIQPANLVHATA
ncbi:MAG: hypothetical protein NVS2B12_13250 [Ktedonobacteraceae bacterium]